MSLLGRNVAHLGHHMRRPHGLLNQWGRLWIHAAGLVVIGECFLLADTLGVWPTWPTQPGMVMALAQAVVPVAAGRARHLMLDIVGEAHTAARSLAMRRR